MKKGLIHIYCGCGKGKTTCAFGLALRALGRGFKVLAVQFCKDGTSGELEALKKSGLDFTFCEGFKPESNFKAENPAKAYENDVLTCFEQMAERSRDYDMLILDELTWGIYYKAVTIDAVAEFLKNKPEHLEVIITGRYPPDEILALADYVTEMKLVKHPFEKGIPAREGIEM